MHFRGETTSDLGCNWKFYVEHCLATHEPGMSAEGEEIWSWAWPALIIRHAQGNAEVQQVIPRSFSRSRVVQYVLAADDALAATAMQAAQARIAHAKAACENAQQSVEQGLLPAATHALVEAFRARLRDASAMQPVV